MFIICFTAGNCLPVKPSLWKGGLSHTSHAPFRSFPRQYLNGFSLMDTLAHAVQITELWKEACRQCTSAKPSPGAWRSSARALFALRKCPFSLEEWQTCLQWFQMQLLKQHSYYRATSIILLQQTPSFLANTHCRIEGQREKRNFHISKKSHHNFLCTFEENHPHWIRLMRVEVTSNTISTSRRYASEASLCTLKAHPMSTETSIVYDAVSSIWLSINTASFIFTVSHMLYMQEIDFTTESNKF